MNRYWAYALIFASCFLIVVAEVERMDNEVTTQWSQE